MQHHALTKNNQLRPVFFKNLLGLLHINFKEIVFTNREIHNCRALRYRVHGDIIVQRPHWLRAEMSTFDDMVIEHVA